MLCDVILPGDFNVRPCVKYIWNEESMNRRKAVRWTGFQQQDRNRWIFG